MRKRKKFEPTLSSKVLTYYLTYYSNLSQYVMTFKNITTYIFFLHINDQLTEYIFKKIKKKTFIL